MHAHAERDRLHIRKTTRERKRASERALVHTHTLEREREREREVLKLGKTKTKVGYGDLVPTTHVGRLVCAMATLMGITLASLITAALGNMMTYNSSEQAALAVVEREMSRIKLREKVCVGLCFSVYLCLCLPPPLHTHTHTRMFHSLSSSFLPRFSPPAAAFLLFTLVPPPQKCYCNTLL